MMRTRLTSTAIALFLLLLAQSAFAADKYKFNPFTNKMDNVGDGIANSAVTPTGEVVCPTYSGGYVTWAVCGAVATEDRILTEAALYLTTEDDKYLLP
jgi:hypothetical protein